MLVSELKKHLESWADDAHVAHMLWLREDVLTRAAERKLTITDEQADEVLEQMDNRADATHGMSWDTLDFYMDEVMGGEDAGEEQDDETPEQG